MLRQRAERPETRTEGQHNVGARNEFHRGFRTLIAERAARQRVARRERIVVQIAVDHRGGQVFGQCHAILDAVRHHHAAAGQNDRELGFGEQARRVIERIGPAGAALDFLRRLDFKVAFAVVVIARNVDLHRTALVHRDGERAMHEFGHARG